jgi:hypothetical protein
MEWEWEGEQRYRWHVVIEGVLALLTVNMLGVVTIVDVGVDPIESESGPSKTRMCGITWPTWSVKSMPPARRFGHARVGKGGWA